MRQKLLITISLTFLFFSASKVLAQQPKVLIILPSYYGLNHYLNMEMFQSFGWDLTLAGLTQVVPQCPYAGYVGGTPQSVDILISDITDITEYDCLAIASMSWNYYPQTAYDDLLNSQEALDLISTANDSGLVIWSTCAGVRVLAAANIINGINVQGQPGPGNLYANEVIAAGGNYLGSQLLPVIDGNIVTTTRGQYYMIQNCEAVMTALENVRKSKTNGGLIK